MRYEDTEPVAQPKLCIWCDEPLDEDDEEQEYYCSKACAWAHFDDRGGL